MAAPPSTKLSSDQVLARSFDVDTGKLRVDAAVSVSDLEVEISQTNDSIRVGDGTNLITATVDGAKVGLDVNVLNDIELDISAASDSIAISDGTDTLAINSDGSINVNSTDVNAYDFYYDEVDDIASGVLTTIVSFTAVISTRLQRVLCAGENQAIYTILVNGNILAKRYTYAAAGLNTDFDFGKGINIPIGQTVEVKVLHDRPTLSDFNATLEITTTP